MTQINNVLLFVLISFLLSIGTTFLTIFIDKIVDLHAIVKNIPLMLNFIKILSYDIVNTYLLYWYVWKRKAWFWNEETRSSGWYVDGQVYRLACDARFDKQIIFFDFAGLNRPWQWTKICVIFLQNIIAIENFRACK